MFFHPRNWPPPFPLTFGPALPPSPRWEFRSFLDTCYNRPMTPSSRMAPLLVSRSRLFSLRVRRFSVVKSRVSDRGFISGWRLPPISFYGRTSFPGWRLVPGRDSLIRKSWGFPAFRQLAVHRFFPPFAQPSVDGDVASSVPHFDRQSFFPHNGSAPGIGIGFFFLRR